VSCNVIPQQTLHSGVANSVSPVTTQQTANQVIS